MSVIPSRREYIRNSSKPILISVDGSCLPGQFGPCAGYGVYINHDIYNANVCEPVPGLIQSAQIAEVRGMLCALEMVSAMRPRRAVIYSDSQYVCNGYNDWMHSWSQNDWRKADGTPIAFPDLWKRMLKEEGTISVRRIVVQVRWKPRNSSEGQERADKLAKQACTLHEICPYCRLPVGRELDDHECRPVCVLGSCTGDREFADRTALQQHVAACHSIVRPCRRSDCDMVFGSEASALSHEERIHDGYVFECDHCEDVFDNAAERDYHQKQVCPYAKHCFLCDREFVHSRARNQHLRDYHGCYTFA